MAKEKPILYFVLGVAIALAVVGLIFMFRGGAEPGRATEPDYRSTYNEWDYMRTIGPQQPAGTTYTPQQRPTAYQPSTTVYTPPAGTISGTQPTSPAPTFTTEAKRLATTYQTDLIAVGNIVTLQKYTILYPPGASTQLKQEIAILQNKARTGQIQPGASVLATVKHVDDGKSGYDLDYSWME